MFADDSQIHVNAANKEFHIINKLKQKKDANKRRKQFKTGKLFR